MKRNSNKTRSLFLAFLGGAFLLSCAPLRVNALPLVEEEKPVDYALPLSRQIEQNLEEGLNLSFSSLDLSIPGKIEGKSNDISLEGASAYLRLNGLSVHDFEANLHLPIDYNGVSRIADLSLADETAYFSLSWPEGSDEKAGGLRFKTSLSSYEDGGMDKATRGVFYYEYGTLDYFLYSILEAFEIKDISLSSSSGESFSFDFEAFQDALDEITLIGTRYFRFDLPLGEQTLSFGLGANEQNEWNRIDFPLDEENHLSSYEFPNGMSLSFSAEVSPKVIPSFELPYPSSSYLEIADSLDLIKEVGDKVSKKTFSLNGDLAISHIEGEIEGDDSHFARDAFEENGTLTLFANVDLSSAYKDITASLDLSCEGNTESLGLHIQDEDGTARAYLNLNNILRASTNIQTLSSFASEIKGAFTDEDIQNETIMKLLSGLLSSIDAVTEAIDGIKNSAVYSNIEEGHYEGLLSAISSLTHQNNRLVVELDLAKANGVGSARIEIDSASSDLVSVHFDNAGISSGDDGALTLGLTGTITLSDYIDDLPFDPSPYVEMDHLPSIAEEISRIGESDQLGVDLQGYFLHKDTVAVTSYTLPSYTGNRSFSYQGLSFSGSLGFDLKAQTGTGKATLTDHKENFFQDHNLKLDVTGPRKESDSAEKDFAGNEGDTGYLLVQYDSSNASSKSAENRTEPEGEPLKGRLSINSLDDALDLVSSLLSSTDPRFKRLTNLFSKLTTKTVIGAILDGHYLEALAAGFLTSASIDNASRTDVFTLKEGLIMPHYPITMRLRFREDYENEEGVLCKGLPETLEILSSSTESDGNEIYAKITFGSTDFEADPIDFNWMGGSYSLNDFTSYSSISHLLDYLLGTITLGTTDESYLTTYHLNATIPLKILTTTYDISINAFIYLDGTNVKIAASVNMPEIRPVGIVEVVSANTYTNIYYETSGEDSEGELYMERFTHHDNTLTDDDVSQGAVRVKGSDFSENLLDWLLKYILNMGSIVTDNLDSGSSASKSIHGEDLISSFSTGGTFENPTWNIGISMKALTHISMFEDLSLSINGKTVTYSSSGKTYTRKSLSSASGSLALKIIGISAASATLSLSIKNITSNGAYENGWSSSSHKMTVYTGFTSKKTLWITNYTLQSTSLIPSEAFASYYAKRTSLGYTVTP